MPENKVQELYENLCGLCVFRDVLTRPLFSRFLDYAAACGFLQKRMAYGAFVNEIYREGGDLTACVRRAVLEDENVYVAGVAANKPCDPHIAAAVEWELTVLSSFSRLKAQDFCDDMGLEGPVAAFSSGEVALAEEYRRRLSDIHKYGYGIFASYGMFRVRDTGEPRMEPIVNADPVTLDSFVGYREEREQVLANTQAFVNGKPAANVLLYGDAGTGKSSTVKAVANHFFSEGVRLIEIRKDQMSLLPMVMDKISANPLKFIIFIDDLSFNRNDDTFSMLKAALEGSASAKASNAVIYATSNRRHIVRECFDEREGSDVHRNDTMQELLSLSARFGLTIRFEKPDKALYLAIVHELAQKKNVVMEPDRLDIAAEAFALRCGHRSARCAEQFVDSLL